MIGLLLPAVQKVRAAAARAQCQNQLKQIGLAVNNCAGTYAGKLPGMGSFPTPNLGRCPSSGNGFGGVLYHLCPFMEQGNLYNMSVCSSGGYDCEAGGGGIVERTVVKFLLCPGDPTAGSGIGAGMSVGSYCYNALVFTEGSRGFANYPATFQDGTSNTIIFSEQYAGATPQFPSGYVSLWWWDYNTFQAPKGYDGDCGSVGYTGTAYPPLFTPSITYCMNNKISTTWGATPSACMCRPTSPHSAAINLGLADGSVRTMSQGVSGTTFYNACTPYGGVPLGSDW